MTVHLCRDFLTLPSSSAPATNLYLLGAFLRSVLNYTQVANVNFDLESSTFVVAEGTTATVEESDDAVIVVSTLEHTVSEADHNRILALRSLNYPLQNSGLFRVISSSISTNSFIVDFRTLSTPAFDTMSWALYKSEYEVTASWNSGSNGRSGYNSTYFASASRVVLQSPDLSGWQVRLCLESSGDIGGVPILNSVAPGMNATLTADFYERGLHAPMFFDSKTTLYRGSAIGMLPGPTNNQWARKHWRFNAIGDDVNGTCTVVTRAVSGTIGEGWLSFGIPENEDPTLSASLSGVDTLQRLFVFGHVVPSASINWKRSGFHADNDMMGVGWSHYRKPLPCIASSYCEIKNTTTHFRNNINASDNPWLNATELLDVQLVVGTLPTTNAYDFDSIFDFEPRPIGHVPFLKQGRANFGSWTASQENDWIHTMNGVYMKWGGPLPTDMNTSSSVYEIPGTNYADQSGFILVSIADAEPSVFELPEQPEPIIVDIDKNRLKKTYSFFRQPRKNIRIIKE